MKNITILFVLLAGLAHAAVTTWPLDSEWEPLYLGSDVVTDGGHDALNAGADDDHLDIVGSASSPAGYMLNRIEGTEEQFLFRIRLDNYRKANKAVYYQVFFNTDSDPDLDYALELSTQININLISPALRFTEVSSGGTSTAITLSNTDLWTEPNGLNYANWAGAAPDGLGVFIDLAMPASAFYSATGLSSNMPFTAFLSSSKDTGIISGDIAMHDGTAVPAITDLTSLIPVKPGYVEGLSPDSAGQLGGTQITINGLDLCDGTLTDITSITINGIPVASIDSVSTTQIVVTAAASIATGTGDLVITSTYRGTTTKENAFTYLYEIPTYALNIESAHGIPTPAIGSHTNDEGTVVSLSVDSTIENGTTQYVSTGWSANDGSSGTTNAFDLTVTADLTVTWQWATNYWIEIAGSSVTGQWAAAGTVIELTPPNKDYYTFSGWSGDVISTNNPLSLTVSGPVQLTAEYDAIRTVNTGTPIWWLVDQGYTENFEDAALANPDGDILPNWKEYVAGTDPFAESILNLKSTRTPTGRSVSWNTVAERTYTVLWGTNIVDGAVTNVLVDAYVPDASGIATIEDPRPEFPLMYYRVIVTIP